MNASTDTDDPAIVGNARTTRLFGWAMLSLLVAFLIANILVVGFGFAPVDALLNGVNWQSLILVALYLAALVWAFLHVTRTEGGSLRDEARRISDFNAWLVRGCFFAVLFVGIVDAGIAFLRVEGLLSSYFSEAMAKDLIRSHFIGPYIHMPLIVLGFIVALFSRSLGFIWLALLIVAAELMIVISRFVFSYEQALMGDLVRYWYAALFLFSSAYTLVQEGHVRVDVFYAGFTDRGKAKVNALGSILLGISTSWCILLIGMGTKQAIINAPIANFEVSQSGTAGMFIKYQMGAFLAVFAITMLIQFVSYLFEASADLRGEPGKQAKPAVAH